MIEAKFISIEGSDGAGKSTQLKIIADILRRNEIDFVMTREPGGTALGETLRKILLDQDECTMADETELLLMFTARTEHISSVIKPALKQGKWVVSDRFADASFAYQGARGVSSQRIQDLADWVLQGFAPDLTLWFDLPVEQGLDRVKQRGERDRFEVTSLAYKQKVQAIYAGRAQSEPGRIKRIDASVDIEKVSFQVREQVQAFIDLPSNKV